MPRSSQKRDAILAIGLDLPTTEILAAAAASGVTVSRAYVDLLKKAGSQGSAPATAPDVDTAFRAAAIALVLQGGMEAAREALAAVVEQIYASVNMA